jgi:autotransporter-associated beta strand protein
MTRLLTALMAMWQIGQPLQGATINWTAGSGANLNWATAGNWSTGLPLAVDDVIFGSPIPNPGSLANPGTITLGSGTVANSLSFLDNYTLSGGDLALGTGLVRVDANATISSSLTGAGGLNKAGTGTLTLLGTNSGLTGPVVVSGGVLKTSGSATLGTGLLSLAGGNLAFESDTGLNFTNATTVLLNSLIFSGRQSSGAGVTHTLGTLSIGPQQLSIQSGANVSSGTAGVTFGATTLTGSGTGFNVGAGANLTLGVIAGNFNFFKSGAGTLTLGGASTRASGAAYLTGGTTRQTNVSGFGTAATTLTMTGGSSLDLATDTSTNAYPATFLGSATVISNRATAGAGITHQLGAFSSIGNNTITIGKDTNVSSGTAGVTFAAATTAGATTFSVASGALLTLSSTLNNAGFNTTFTGAGNATASSAISGGGGVIMNGTGILTLSGANTFGGAATINSGTVQLGNAASLGAAATASPVLTGSGILSVNGVTASVLSISGLSGTIIQNNHVSTAGVLAVTPGGTAQSTIASTIRNGSTGTMGITVNGSGSLALTGNNTYTGPTILTQGRLNVNSATAVGTGAVTLTAGMLDNTSVGAVTLTNNNAVTVGGNFTFGGSNSLNFGTGTATTTASRVITLAGTNTSNLRFGTYNSNAASLTTTVNSLSGSNSTLTIGTFNAQGSGTAGTTVIAGNGNLAITGGINATVLATGMNFAGSGIITLSGASNYTGATTFTSGRVILDASSTAATLVATTLPTFAGGAFTLKAAAAGSNQTLGNLTLNAGGSNISVIGGTGGTSTLTLGTYTATTNNGTMNVSLSGTGANVSTTTAVTSGLIAPRGAVTITSGGVTDFAGKSGSNLALLTGQTALHGDRQSDSDHGNLYAKLDQDHFLGSWAVSESRYQHHATHQRWPAFCWCQRLFHHRFLRHCSP